MRHAIAAVVSSLALASAGCNCGGPMERDAGPTPADAGPADAGYDAGAIDAGLDAGAIDSGLDAGPPPARRTSVFQTSAGGAASSPSYRGRFSIGAPQPAGSTAGVAGRLTTGPAAARP
jgi:hypothetical protein